MDRVINGTRLSNSSFKVMSYCWDRSAMLLHGLVTRRIFNEKAASFDFGAWRVQCTA